MKPIFPELRTLADAASNAAQKTFLMLNVAQLCFLALSVFASGISPSSELHKHEVSWGVAILMALALVCTIALRLGNFDVRWFKCRAFAENAKSLAWRYVMVGGDDCASPRDTYLTEWSRLKQRMPELQRDFALAGESGQLITQWMIDVAQKSLEDRLLIYRKHRVDDQIKWYASNAKRNARKQSRWFWALFLIEVFAIAYASLQAWLLLPVNLVGFVATIGSGIVAWSQTKRHSDLSTSYAIAAEDISLISEKFRYIKDQHAMNDFVDNIEEAVSREHSMWLARRNC